MGGIFCYLEKLNVFYFCIVVYFIFIDIGFLILRYVGQSLDDINFSIYEFLFYKQVNFNVNEVIKYILIYLEMQIMIIGIIKIEIESLVSICILFFLNVFN